MLEISDTGNTTFARENLLLLNLSADEPLNLISEGFPRYFVSDGQIVRSIRRWEPIFQVRPLAKYSG